MRRQGEAQHGKQRGFAARDSDLRETSPAAREHLAGAGYDPVYGARPLKRLIQQTLESPVARRIVAGDVNDGDNIKVRVENGALVIG